MCLKTILKHNFHNFFNTQSTKEREPIINIVLQIKTRAIIILKRAK